MNILVVNSGSSSIKFQLFEMPCEKLLMKSKAVKNELGKADFNFITRERDISFPVKEFSFRIIFEKLLEELIRPESQCLSSNDEIDIIGHRLIHGGEQGTDCVIITEELIAYMESCISLAPLHYPANLEGIRTIRQMMPRKIQAGVFDTAFHSTLPPKAFLYGISPEWYRKHHIRRYGFHGTSHKYASARACQLAGIDFGNCKIVSCHLGNGASAAAVKNGKSIDTSMGFTPVEGLVMGSRCGDIDAEVLLHIMENHHYSTSRIRQLINREAGLLGLSGVSSDYREVEKAAEKGNASARLALDVYHYRVKKYIGAYAATLEGIDILVFTGGVGENSSNARTEICKGLQFLGIDLDIEKNEKPDDDEAMISSQDSKVAVAVIAANEELEIARKVAELAASHIGKG